MNKLIQFIHNGVTVFRINASFIKIDDLKSCIQQIRNTVENSAKILIDLPGYKIRFLNLDENIIFKAEMPFELKKEYFNYPDFFDLIEVGTIIRINDGFNMLTITEMKERSIVCTANSNGTIRKGKGIHIDNKSYRPLGNMLSSHDLKLLDAVKQCDIDYIGLSFVHDMEDVKYVERELGATKIECIPKIESKESVKNLHSILKDSKMIILDRGDLSGEIGLENIWKVQKDIISLCKKYDCRIIVATQVLANMTSKPLPTIAEVESLYGLLDKGVSGIQLSEETSIGKYSEECIRFVFNAAAHFLYAQNDNSEQSNI